MYPKTYTDTSLSIKPVHESEHELLMRQVQEKSIESILDWISDGIFIVDKELLITSCNRAAEQITGVPRQEAIGQRCSKVFRSSLCEKNCIMQKTFATKTPMLNLQGFLINEQGHNVPVNLSTILLRNRHNEVIGGVEIIQDLRPFSLPQKKSTVPVQFDELITRNKIMGRIIRSLPTIAASQDNVLIEGEAGTGREVLARNIHAFSCRRQKPFLSVNCVTLQNTPFPMELFENRSSFFAGVYAINPAFSSLTEGGTLFLNEIGETSREIQGQLMRVLREENPAAPETANTESQSNIRVIASTRQNLLPRMITRTFHRDLYLHINRVRLELPPLRERKEDIPLLIDHFISLSNRQHGKSVAGVNQEAFDLLLAYDFPGNISELKNIIAHAHALCAEDFISPSQLPVHMKTITPHMNNESFDIEIAVHTVEAQTIIAALKRNKYNRTAAARDLGIHKSTFFRKIKHLGIILPRIDGRFRSIA